MDGQTGLDRRTFFKGAGLVGASLAVPSLLSACGGEGAGATGGAQKLEFWWNPSVESADQMTAWMNGVIKEFTAANKGTTIKSVTQPSEQMASNFRTACQSQAGPASTTSTPVRTRCSSSGRSCIAPLSDGTTPTPSRPRPAAGGPQPLQVPGQDLGAALVQRAGRADVQQGALQRGRARPGEAADDGRRADQRRGHAQGLRRDAVRLRRQGTSPVPATSRACGTCSS